MSECETTNIDESVNKPSSNRVINEGRGGSISNILDEIQNTEPEITQVTMEHEPKDALNVLTQMRLKYMNNLIIGHLNTNTLANKFDALNLIINYNILGETKLDASFPENQFYIDGFMAYCRYGRVCCLVKLRISMIRTFSFGNISHITLYAQLEIV